MICGFLQAFGASAGLSVADIYKQEERCTAMGVFYGVSHCRFVTTDVLTSGM
jgi:hypothetical protein